MTMTWSQPCVTGLPRAASLRACGGVNGIGWRRASKMTKSFPAPCILMKECGIRERIIADFVLKAMADIELEEFPRHQLVAAYVLVYRNPDIRIYPEAGR